MNVDAVDFGGDAAMDFDMGGDFLLDDVLGRAASESSLVTGTTRKPGQIKQVWYFFF